MKPNKLTILICLILSFTMIIVIKDNQYDKTIAEYLDRENKQEDELAQSIKNYTDLEEMYLELKQENIELKEQSDIVWEGFICTGYSDYDGEQGTNGITATGFPTNCGLPIIAVDPKVIKPYSIVEIEGLGRFVALDTGDAIKGNRIDILFSSKEEAINFGIKELSVRMIR